MKKALIQIAIFASLLISCSTGFDNEKEEQLILEAIELQKKSWNSYDIDGFMKHYWNSESMQFMTKDGIRKGWQTTMDNYKSSYPTPNDMGELDFDIKHIDVLSKESAYVLGQWKLLTDSAEYGGHFSLVWKKINGKWLIVTDHTS